MDSTAVLSMSSPAKRTTIIRPKKKIKEPTIVTNESVPAVIPSLAVVATQEPYCDPSLFIKHQVRRKLVIPFHSIARCANVTELLTLELAKQLEGRCSIEGYICPYSVSISSHSCGTLSGANIIFDIVADCLICFPDERTIIKCVAKTITQAGIRAGATQLAPGRISPIEVFLSRDMNINNELFHRIEENDILTVEIIGRRFVLHDTHVTIIAMLLDAESPSP